MAREFPHAEVIGLDLTNPERPGDHPPNCQFEVANANEKLPHEDASLNVVHGRLVHAGIRDFHLFLYETARVLRPNGVLMVMSGGPVSNSAPDWRSYHQLTIGCKYSKSSKRMERLYP